MSEKYVSVAEIQEQGDYNHLSFAFGAPSGIDFEHIQVNMQAFRRMRLTSGLGDVCVAGVRNEDLNDFSGNINSDGSISSIASVTRQSRMGIDKSNSGRGAFYVGSYRPDITIPFSVGETIRNLGQSKYDTATEHVAAELAKTLRSGMLEGSNHSHAIDQVSFALQMARFHKAYTVVLGGMIAYSTYAASRNIGDLLSTKEYMNFGSQILIGNAVSVGAGKIIGPNETSVKEHKWSLFNAWGIPIDRLIGAQVALRASKPLISVRK
ncbi:hypothetical protein BH10PAT3_BH10PAT3_4860 [soil metagenome]